MDSFPLYSVDASHDATLAYMHVEEQCFERQVILCVESCAGRNYGNVNVKPERKQRGRRILDLTSQISADI